MQVFFLEHSAGFHTVEARNVWKEYTEDYYHMDTYYRQYHLAFGKSLTVGNDHLDDLFKQVTDKVEGLYTHWFLGELGSNWSDACAEELAKYGRIMEVPQQEDFYNQKVKGEDNRVFVIISDALRYEVAASLAEQLRRETQSKVALGSCEGIFPTVTKFGMLQHFYCENGFLQEEVVGTRDYNLQQSYSYIERVNLFSAYTEKIQSVLFDGIKKGVFSTAKFDSHPELLLARVLETDTDVLNWLRPAPQEFNITYNHGHNYEPDFVVETGGVIYLVEVKGEDKLKDPDVIAKKKRGVQYCEVASRWGKANGYKEWRYLFIPSKQVMPNSSFMQLARQFDAK